MVVVREGISSYCITILGKIPSAWAIYVIRGMVKSARRISHNHDLIQRYGHIGDLHYRPHVLGDTVPNLFVSDRCRWGPLCILR